MELEDFTKGMKLREGTVTLVGRKYVHVEGADEVVRKYLPGDLHKIRTRELHSTRKHDKPIVPQPNAKQRRHMRRAPLSLMSLPDSALIRVP